MRFPPLLQRLLAEPPPEHAFEISEAGVAHARTAQPNSLQLVPLPPGAVVPSPLKDNVALPDALAAAITEAAGKAEARRRKAVVILPDYCARVATLEFDSFPAKPEEQVGLVRFRLKKSVPFDVEAAVVGYQAFPLAGGRMEVAAALVPLEIVARYEAPFRAAGLQAGLVMPSLLAALELVSARGAGLLAKLSGRVLTAAVLREGRPRLVRCVELPEVSAEEMLNVLYPTVAYMEDEMQARPERLLLCGFGPENGSLRQEIEAELGLPLEPLQSRLGAPGESNAGLLGYLQAATGGAATPDRKASAA